MLNRNSLVNYERQDGIRNRKIVFVKGTPSYKKDKSKITDV